MLTGRGGGGPLGSRRLTTTYGRTVISIQRWQPPAAASTHSERPVRRPAAGSLLGPAGGGQNINPVYHLKQITGLHYWPKHWFDCGVQSTMAAYDEISTLIAAMYYTISHPCLS